MLFRNCLVAAFIFATLGVPLAKADSASDSFIKNLGLGQYNLGEMAKTGEAKARAGSGMLQFVGAVEHLGQALYRYGAHLPNSRRSVVGGMMPILRLPIPVNPKPERLTYADARKILEAFVKELDLAEGNMAALGDTEIKLPVDLLTIRLDFNSNGKPDPGETLGEILQAVSRNPLGSEDQAKTPTAMKVNFDTADVYWLRGYTRFLAAYAQFLLAHDFEKSFNVMAHNFFPGAGDDTSAMLDGNRGTGPLAEAEIGDTIALIHTTNWPVIDAAKRDDVRLRLIAMADLVPKTWAAARAETDDDLEWLPNAKQHAITGTQLKDEEIDSWIAIMAEFSKVLKGESLLPHWRFDKGFNLKRWFQESKNYDLVMTATGQDVVRYLESGPVSDSVRWNQLMRGLNGTFMSYAIWFN